jgi:hypothetical protein
LVDAFTRWAHRHGRAADPVVIEALIDHRWEDGDGVLCRWGPDDLVEALLDWFPRRMTMPAAEWPVVLPSVAAFVDFLFTEDLADERCADRDDLHVALEAMAGEFDAAMADETRYGIAKFWAMRMLAEGVDIADERATEAFIARVNAGRVEFDQAVLGEVMANHQARMLEDPGVPPPLPVVWLPDREALRALADDTVAVRRIRRFTEWVGAGRVLTTTGRLKRTDARELIDILGTSDVMDPVIGGRVFRTGSTEALYELSIVFAWARGGQSGAGREGSGRPG